MPTVSAINAYDPIDPINPVTTKTWKRTWKEYISAEAQLPANGQITAKYHTADGATTVQEQHDSPALLADLSPGVSERVFDSSIRFTLAGENYVARGSSLYKNIDPLTNAGTYAGTIDLATGRITLTNFVAGSKTLTLRSLTKTTDIQPVSDVQFRTPGAPIRPGSLYVQCQDSEGNTLSGTADFSGYIDSGALKGGVNYETGVVNLWFGEVIDAAGHEAEDWYVASAVIDGKIWRPSMVWADTVKFNCVVYSYLPLDADLIGIDPVRLPQDGRVPIFRAGDIVLVHHQAQDTMPSPLSADQVVVLSRDNISAVDLYDQDGDEVSSALYTVDLAAGEITMGNPLDLSGYTEPLIAVHRREDMVLCADVQISGTLTLIRGIDHDYPESGALVSSVLPYGDLRGRVYNEFEQETWGGEWSDDLIGDAPTAAYNSDAYPIVTTNRGAIEERWALIFDSADHFDIVGERSGVIGDGYITNDTDPNNPITGAPYFFIDYRGWGSGWSAGNVLRFNTEAANAPIWLVRTTLPGPVVEPDDEFILQIRGDVD